MSSEMNLKAFGGEQRPQLPNKPRGARARAAETTGAPANDEKEEMMNSVNLVQWAVCGPHTYKPVSSTFPKLASGVYSVAVSQYHGIIY